jgi:hypothetical protein
MKKEATLKCKGLRKNTFDKKEATIKHKGIRKKASDKKRDTTKTHEGDTQK